MNFTVHLTENCNMACSYCLREKTPRDMSLETLYKTIDLAYYKGNKAGFCFFGGEPLLKKDLIYEALDYCEKKTSETGIPFACKMTTNGTLIDEEFLNRAKAVNMKIGLSFDGKGQDISRRFPDGSSTAGILEKKAKLILSYLPNTMAMLTLDPKACSVLCDSVKYLLSLGFRDVSTVMAYGKNVSWTDEDLEVYKVEINKVADFLRDEFKAGRKHYVTPLVNKIRECVNGKNPAEHCHLGVRQLSVTPDGNIYPCTSFINDEEYYMGNVFEGLDKDRMAKIAAKSNTPETCKECDLKSRCTNSCGCANRMNTGSADKVSPLQCTYERTIIEVADRLGNELYEYNAKEFADFFAVKA